LEKSGICAFLLILLLQFYPWYYLVLSFYSYTCWVLTISILNIVIFSCYSNLLLRRRWWNGILLWEVLRYVLPWLSFLWCYRVFHYSVSLRVVIVFRDTIYVIIIILYLWYLVIYEHFWSYVWNNWSWVIHMISTWFWHKNRIWHCPADQTVSTCKRSPRDHVSSIHGRVRVTTVKTSMSTEVTTIIALPGRTWQCLPKKNLSQRRQPSTQIRDKTTAACGKSCKYGTTVEFLQRPEAQAFMELFCCRCHGLKRPLSPWQNRLGPVWSKTDWNLISEFMWN
jgi:hypothetical protein